MKKIAPNTHFYNGVFNRFLSIEMKGVVNKLSIGQKIICILYKLLIKTYRFQIRLLFQCKPETRGRL